MQNKLDNHVRKGSCQRLFWAQWFSVRGGGYPPIPLRKIPLKSRYFRSENSIFCLFSYIFSPFWSNFHNGVKIGRYCKNPAALSFSRHGRFREESHIMTTHCNCIGFQTTSACLWCTLKSCLNFLNEGVISTFRYWAGRVATNPALFIFDVNRAVHPYFVNFWH